MVYLFFAISSLLAFGLYRFFLHMFRMNELSDRAFVFSSITMGTIGSLMLLDFDTGNLNNVRICVSYSVLGIAYIVGMQATSKLYSKLIGCHTDAIYSILPLIIIILAGILGPYATAHLYTKFSYNKVFGLCLALYGICLPLVAYFMHSLMPHYSYLIEKQKQMLKKDFSGFGINNKDMQLLNTVDFKTTSYGGGAHNTSNPLLSQD